MPNFCGEFVSWLNYGDAEKTDLHGQENPKLSSKTERRPKQKYRRGRSCKRTE